MSNHTDNPDYDVFDTQHWILRLIYQPYRHRPLGSIISPSDSDHWTWQAQLSALWTCQLTGLEHLTWQAQLTALWTCQATDQRWILSAQLTAFSLDPLSVSGHRVRQVGLSREHILLRYPLRSLYTASHTTISNNRSKAPSRALGRHSPYREWPRLSTRRRGVLGLGSSIDHVHLRYQANPRLLCTVDHIHLRYYQPQVHRPGHHHHQHGNDDKTLGITI